MSSSKDFLEAIDGAGQPTYQWLAEMERWHQFLTRKAGEQALPVMEFIGQMIPRTAASFQSTKSKKMGMEECDQRMKI